MQLFKRRSGIWQHERRTYDRLANELVYPERFDTPEKRHPDVVNQLRRIFDAAEKRPSLL